MDIFIFLSKTSIDILTIGCSSIMITDAGFIFMPRTVLIHGVTAGVQWAHVIVNKRQELTGVFIFMKNEYILVCTTVRLVYDELINS